MTSKVVQATCAKMRVDGVTFLLEDGEPGQCLCTSNHAEMMRRAQSLAPGHVLTYGGTAGPDTNDDHWVVHLFHLDFEAKPFKTSDYVEPQHVKDQRDAALRDFVRVPYVAPEPVPFDFVKACERPQERAWPERDPEPEHSTRDPFPADLVVPKPMLDLKKKAEAAGWECRIGYSRAMRRAVRIGTYDRVEVLGLWSAPHPDSGWRFSAMYERKPDGAKSAQAWKWGSVSVWRAGQFAFPYCSVTDLKEFIGVRGSVLPSWFDSIKARVRAQADKNKAAAKARPSKSKNEGN